MYVIMVYDVHVKRVTKVLHIGRKYLVHIQNSLLEGELSPGQFKRLKTEVAEVIDDGHDTVLFYVLRHKHHLDRQTLGIASVDPEENFF